MSDGARNLPDLIEELVVLIVEDKLPRRYDPDHMGNWLRIQEVKKQIHDRLPDNMKGPQP